MCICSVCSESAELLCQRCREPYCSRKCQVHDWQAHKEKCFPMPGLMMRKKPEVKGQEQKKVDKNISLRPPKSVLPKCDVTTTEQRKSLFQNPSKCNSKNIAFKANYIKDTATSLGGCERMIKTRSAGGSDVKIKTNSPVRSDTIVEIPSPDKNSTDDKRDVDSAITSMKTLSLEITMNDIEVVPLSAGKKLFCLDFSNIGKGYISACVHDEKAIAQIESLCAKISDYCNRTKEYSPQADELCLSEFEGQWYRAVVKQVIDSDSFDIMFIDYGNIITANIKDIRMMPKEFTHFCLMNKCYIKGFPEKTKDEIYNMASFFDKTPIFEVLSLEANDGDFIIEPKMH